MSSAFADLHRHLPQLRRALTDLERQAPLVERWGAELADVLGRGGRLIAAAGAIGRGSDYVPYRSFDLRLERDEAEN